jgi:hypothetical protein
MIKLNKHRNKPSKQASSSIQDKTQVSFLTQGHSEHAYGRNQMKGIGEILEFR